MRRRSCETCPHRMPMDSATWKKVAKTQRQVAPQLSRGQCAKLTRIEKQQFEGLEDNVKNCKGYSRVQALGNYLLRKVSLAHKIKRTEAGGTRFVSWHERTCNNPYLDSPEYFNLLDQFEATGSEEEAPSRYKSERQREGHIEDTIGMQQMTLGAGVLAVGAAIAEGAPDVLKPIGVGIAGVGLYTAVTGGGRLVQGLVTQVQEFRNRP